MKTIGLELNCPEFFQNPYPFYADIRASGQPLWLGHRQDSSSDGVWLFANYHEALELFKQTTTISKSIQAIRPKGSNSPFDLHMLHRDGADHLRLRRLVAHYYSQNYIKQLAPILDTTIDKLIDKMAGKSQIDFMADFAEPLPLHIVAHMVGINETDIPKIRSWSLLIGEGFDSVRITEDILLQQKRALTEFMSYVEQLIAAKRQHLTDDLLSFLISSEKENKIQPAELIGMVGFLLFSGHETTINLLGNGAYLLLQHPEQLNKLVNQPELLPQAIEEILRYESPEQRTSFRITTEALTIGGIDLEEGQQVGVIIGAANRDENQFENPDQFNIEREPNQHLAFGFGIHNCLGKILAREEAKAAFSKLIPHLMEWKRVDSTANWRTNSFFRGLETLRLTKKQQ